jgi:hypothetical protein
MRHDVPNIVLQSGNMKRGRTDTFGRTNRVTARAAYLRRIDSQAVDAPAPLSRSLVRNSTNFVFKVAFVGDR